jgi:UDP-N-acetylmuramyl pentapeptide phosphotransferase/UDP-N-acetylglucosamine-1-phosphate transferase
LYAKLWKKNFKHTPRGAGIFLVIPLIIYAYEIDYKLLHLLSLILFLLVYLFDDLIGLKALWKLLIQIITPIVIYFSFSFEFNFIYFVIFILTFIILSNTLNFQDGEDLNVAVLLVLIFTIFYFFSLNLIIKKNAELILIFLFVFIFFNRKKNTLYLGDIGCFISSILIFLFIISDIRNLGMIKIILPIILFPFAEIFYVTLYRIYKKENLFSRNYYYIYQILAKKNKTKIYLFPNLFFALANYLVLDQLNPSIQSILFLMILNLTFSIILRFLINKFSDYNED